MRNEHKYIKDMINYFESGSSANYPAETKSETLLSCMAKGTSILDHTVSRDGFIYAVEGDGTFNLEGKAIPIKVTKETQFGGEGGSYDIHGKKATYSLEAKEDIASILLFRGV